MAGIISPMLSPALSNHSEYLLTRLSLARPPENVIAAEVVVNTGQDKEEIR